MPSTAGIRAGNAYVVIGAIDDTGKMLAKIGRRIQTWGASLIAFGTDTLFKGALLAFPVAEMLRWSTQFDDNMTSVAAKIGATDAEMNTLRRTARSVGEDIGMTTLQISEIMSELSTRDFDASAINAMTRPIALLAKATGKGSDKDASQAAALLSQTLQAFNLDASEAARVADVMTVAANKSNFALNDLADAMAHVAPFAAQMRMPLEDTIAIMAQMRNVGIEAESASIGLRNVMLNVANSKEVKKFNDELKSLGLQTMNFADELGNLENPALILFKIFDRIKRLGTATQAGLLEGLLGKRAIVPATAAGRSKLGFDELLKEMKNAGGESEKVSRKMESSVGGAFRSIRNSIQQVALSLEDALGPFIFSLSKKINTLLGDLRGWMDRNAKLVATLAPIIVGIGTLSVALIGLGVTFKIVGMVLAQFGILLTAVKAGITILVLGITTGFTILAVALSTIPPIVGMVITLFTGMVSLIGSLFYGLGAILISALASGVATITAPWLAFIATILAIPVAAVIAYYSLQRIGEAAVTAFREVSNSVRFIKSVFGDTWKSIADSAVKAFSIVGDTMFAALKLAAIGKFRLSMEVALVGLEAGFFRLKDVVMTIWEDMTLAMYTEFTRLAALIGQQFLDLIQIKNLPADIREALAQAGRALGAGNDIQGRPVRVGRIDEFLKGQDRKNARDARRKEIGDADQAVKDKMNEVAPDLEEADKVFADLKNRVANLANNLAGGQAPAMAAGDKIPKALEGLEKGSIEAAKAAYENSLQEGEGGIQGQQLAAMQAVADNTGRMADNLQVA